MNIFRCFRATAVACLVLLLEANNSFAQVRAWVTDMDRSVYFQEQAATLMFDKLDGGGDSIEVKDNETFQIIDGFGCCLTGGSAFHLMRMAPERRAALLRELFAADGTNIGISYLRISIGSSDLDAHPFSYDDLPPGQTDDNLSKFSLAPDLTAVIPLLKEILAISPQLKLLGSPWSAPAWMKDNHDTLGGSLKPKFYESYAQYFVKYIQGMSAEGIRLDAITVQNEPLNPRNNPSMFMPAKQQALFIKDHLGPAFRRAGIDTKIILYDHNCDHPEYPVSILDDAEAAQYVDGSAFHLYAGQIEALSAVHQAHPDKALYFTEQWMGAHSDPRKSLDQHIRDLVIGATRNWSRNELEWNLASDAYYQPHTDRGGCDRCQGAITISGNDVVRNAAYYVMAHAAKFVRPGSVRIGSNNLDFLPNVAFRVPGGQKVLIVLNQSQQPQTFNIRDQDRQTKATLNSGAVGTYVW